MLLSWYVDGFQPLSLIVILSDYLILSGGKKRQKSAVKCEAKQADF